MGNGEIIGEKIVLGLGSGEKFGEKKGENNEKKSFNQNETRVIKRSYERWLVPKKSDANTDISDFSSVQNAAQVHAENNNNVKVKTADKNKTHKDSDKDSEFILTESDLDTDEDNNIYAWSFLLNENKQEKKKKKLSFQQLVLLRKKNDFKKIANDSHSYGEKRLKGFGHRLDMFSLKAFAALHSSLSIFTGKTYLRKIEQLHQNFRILLICIVLLVDTNIIQSSDVNEDIYSIVKCLLPKTIDDVEVFPLAMINNMLELCGHRAATKSNYFNSIAKITSQLQKLHSQKTAATYDSSSVQKSICLTAAFEYIIKQSQEISAAHKKESKKQQSIKNSLGSMLYEKRFLQLGDFKFLQTVLISRLHKFWLTQISDCDVPIYTCSKLPKDIIYFTALLTLIASKGQRSQFICNLKSSQLQVKSKYFCIAVPSSQENIPQEKTTRKHDAHLPIEPSIAHMLLLLSIAHISSTYKIRQADVCSLVQHGYISNTILSYLQQENLFLFQLQKDTPLKAKALRSQWKKLIQSTEVSKILQHRGFYSTPIDLRHSFATCLYLQWKKKKTAVHQQHKTLNEFLAWLASFLNTSIEQLKKTYIGVPVSNATLEMSASSLGILPFDN